MFDKNEFGNEHSLSDNDYFQYLIESYYSNRAIEEGEKSDESRKKERESPNCNYYTRCSLSSMARIK